MANLGGRPRAKIDLTELEKLCALQCTLPEVAAFFNVSLSTIEKRAASDVHFRETMDRGFLKGKISVRRKQMQMLEAGSQTMAVWLGKQILGQRDKVEHSGPAGAPIGVSVSATDEFTSRIISLATRLRASGANRDTDRS